MLRTPRQVVGLRASHDLVDLAVMVEPAQFGQHATRSCCGRIQEARLQLPEPGFPVLTFPIQRFDAKFPAPLVGVVFQPIEFCECRVPLFRGATVVLPPVLGSRSNFTCAPDTRAVWCFHRGHAQPRELFLNGGKDGSQFDAMLADAATVISIALQFGVPGHALAKSVGRAPNVSTSLPPEPRPPAQSARR